jgi:Raf kinase inhibitor-like YbhB/YbcL family protein
MTIRALTHPAGRQSESTHAPTKRAMRLLVRGFALATPLLVACFGAGCSRSHEKTAAPAAVSPSVATPGAAGPTRTMEGTLKLTSSRFQNGGPIPKAQTCEGGDRSPPLSIADAPAGTKSFALIIDDPDAPDPAAPKMTWVHWVLYNLPPTTVDLAEGVQLLPSGTLQGKNDWKRIGYGGPCPPIGRHRYFHKLFALDRELPDLQEPSQSELEKAMAGHVISEAQLVGTYQKEH